MITLIQFPSSLGLTSPSPFCVKAEALLRVSGVPYQVECWSNPSKAPKGKLPIIRDGDITIADSTFIRKHLETNHGIDFDIHLTRKQRATANAFTKLCEEHLYWVSAYSRWIEPHNWPVVRDAYFGDMPALLRPVITRRLRKAVRNKLNAQGMGLHSRDEIYQLAAEDISSLADYLGDSTFFMGAHHSAVDATVYAFVSGLLHCDIPSPAKDACASHPHLVSYCERMREHYFATDQVLRANAA